MNTSKEAPASTTRTEYLDSLRDLLPSREARQVIADVEGLLDDRVEVEMTEHGLAPEDAERVAVAALGPVEELAEQLASPPLKIDIATRRAFVRSLAIVFAVHLLLSIVLTAAGGSGPAVPGLLAPIPSSPLGAILSSVLSIALVDTGALFLVFALLGRGKAPPLLPRLTLISRASRRDAILSLVLLGLIALILHPFRDEVFAVSVEGRWQGILAPDIVKLLPWFDVALVLFAIRQVTILAWRAEHPVGLVADALGSVLTAVGFVLAATQGDVVHLPEGALGASGADMLETLITRVFLLVFVGAALLMVVRFVKRALRLRQLLA
jgi:hypothetical protein